MGFGPKMEGTEFNGSPANFSAATAQELIQDHRPHPFSYSDQSLGWVASLE